MKRILSIQQFPDTAYRAGKLAAALKNNDEEIDVISLNFNSGLDCALNIMHLTLAEYLLRFGHSVNLVLIDAPQSFLVAESYLKRLCPKVPILVNLRAGPLMEFQSMAQRLSGKIVKVMQDASAILLSGPSESEYASYLGLPDNLCCDIKTPFSNYLSSTQNDPKAISLVADFSHLMTLNKTSQLISLLRATLPSLGLRVFAEGEFSQLSKLEVLPASIQPGVRIFVSDRKEYDNAVILSSLQLGIPVIASDAAAFGLGLSHTKEYLAANHPVTINQQLIKINHNLELAEQLKQAGKAFIQRDRGESCFFNALTSLRRSLASYVAPGPVRLRAEEISAL